MHTQRQQAFTKRVSFPHLLELQQYFCFQQNVCLLFTVFDFSGIRLFFLILVELSTANLQGALCLHMGTKALVSAAVSPTFECPRPALQLAQEADFSHPQEVGETSGIILGSCDSPSAYCLAQQMHVTFRPLDVLHHLAQRRRPLGAYVRDPAFWSHTCGLYSDSRFLFSGLC